MMAATLHVRAGHRDVRDGVSSSELVLMTLDVIRVRR